MEPTQIVVPLLEGFEEIEAVTIVDVLRRAGLEVCVAGDTGAPVRGAHGLSVQPDRSLDAVQSDQVRMDVLPGGVRGAERLRDDPRVQALLRAVHSRGGWIGAICAAPLALRPAGLTGGRTLTSYPGFEDQVADAAAYVTDRVVVDGGLVTSRGPGTALEFALTLVARLLGSEPAESLRERMLIKPFEPPFVAS